MNTSLFSPFCAFLKNHSRIHAPLHTLLGEPDFFSSMIPVSSNWFNRWHLSPGISCRETCNIGFKTRKQPEVRNWDAKSRPLSCLVGSRFLILNHGIKTSNPFGASALTMNQYWPVSFYCLPLISHYMLWTMFNRYHQWIDQPLSLPFPIWDLALSRAVCSRGVWGTRSAANTCPSPGAMAWCWLGHMDAHQTEGLFASKGLQFGKRNREHKWA